ncbi:MAG: APC family permease [Chitinophagaceae bacterium]
MRSITTPSKLSPTIGFLSATCIVIGTIIGSGVFMKPASMAAQLGSPLWLTAVWIIAGVFSLLGALIFAELGAMIPESGGMYVYFRYMFGKFVAFLYGWACLAVINTAAVAAIAFICASYSDYFLHLPRLPATTEQSLIWHIPFLGNLYPLQNIGVKLLTMMLVIGLTFLNYLSVRAGSAFQVISTIVKILVIAALVFGITFSGNGSLQNFTHAEQPIHGWNLLSGIVISLTGAFFAYDGWINVTFVASEIKQPEKNIPKSLFLGVLVCIIVYVCVNQAYLYTLPVEQMAASKLVAADAMSVARGNAGGAIIAAFIVVCTLGAVNGNIMTVVRVTYAMGKDKVIFPWTGKEHKRFRTPGNALWLHAIWTIFFIISGSFDMLADMFVFMTWVAYLMGAIGIFVLRKKLPHQPRPYRVWGFPWVPIVFIFFSAFYLITSVWNDVYNYASGKAPFINSLFGIALTALGIPFYLYYKNKYKNKYKGYTSER